MNESAALGIILISTNVQDMFTVMRECPTKPVVECVKSQLRLHGIDIVDEQVFARLASNLHTVPITMDEKLEFVTLVTGKMPAHTKIHSFFELILTYDSVELIKFIEKELRSGSHGVETVKEFDDLVSRYLLFSDCPMARKIQLAQLLVCDIKEPAQRLVALFKLLEKTGSIDLVRALLHDLETHVVEDKRVLHKLADYLDTTDIPDYEKARLHKALQKQGQTLTRTSLDSMLLELVANNSAENVDNIERALLNCNHRLVDKKKDQYVIMCIVGMASLPDAAVARLKRAVAANMQKPVPSQDPLPLLFAQLGEATPEIVERIEACFREKPVKTFEEFRDWMKPLVDAHCSPVDKMRLVSALSCNKPRELVYGLFMLLLSCDPRAHELVDCIDSNMKFIRTRCIKDDQEFTALVCFLHCSKFAAKDKERLMARLRENMTLPSF